MGAICDKGNVTISGSKGAFVVNEKLAEPLIASLVQHAKLSFSRAGPGALYELDGTLLPQGFLRPVNA